MNNFPPRFPFAQGTVVDQGEPPDYYFSHYSDDNPVLGFITWRWILVLGFDHMFSSPVFLGMLVLLSASLMACTYTTQIPLVKVARRLFHLFLFIFVISNFLFFSSLAVKYQRFWIIPINSNSLQWAGGRSSNRPNQFEIKNSRILYPKHPFRIWVLF